ncbi:RNA-binding domain-containing protein [Deltaproteobacteria bacterium TL4]
MKQQEIIELIAQGENSSVEFKRDDLRPEQLAKEVVAMANLQGGVILLGVEDDGSVSGISRKNLEEWVMDTVFGRYIHPAIIPHYQELQWREGQRIALISISTGTSKPYVVRHNDREDIYVRMGSVTRLATREQALRLFGSGGLLHTETLPVSGSSFKHLDPVRIENYLRDILQEQDMPESEAQWVDRLVGLGFLTTDAMGQTVCTIAGMALFGIRPRRWLPQAGLRVVVFDVADKQYQALLDVVLDGPMVGRWHLEKEKLKTLVDDGLVEKFIRAIEPFVTVEDNQIDQNFRKEKRWLYPMDAIRETVLNALAHRDWTRSVDIEITRYSDRLEIISPGALPNSMTLEKMKAGRRTPRNPILMDVLRDYGYVEARGMGVRTKVIPLTRQFTGSEPLFEATEDYLKTVIAVGTPSPSVPKKEKTSLKNVPETQVSSKNVPKNEFQRHLLSLIRDNPHLTYEELSAQTQCNRKKVQRHLNALKDSGFLRREGSPKGGHWEVLEL